VIPGAVFSGGGHAARQAPAAPPGRSARRDARLWVAARGEEAASVTRREGAPRPASRRAPSRSRRAFRAASSSRRALTVTALRQPGPRVLACALNGRGPAQLRPWAVRPSRLGRSACLGVPGLLTGARQRRSGRRARRQPSAV